MEFLNHGVCEHFAGDPFHFRLRILFRQTPVESDFEILPLPHFLKPLVTDFCESAVDGLTLRIQHALLQRDIDVSFHRQANYTLAAAESDSRFPYGSYALKPRHSSAAGNHNSFKRSQLTEQSPRESLSLGDPRPTLGHLSSEPHESVVVLQQVGCAIVLRQQRTQWTWTKAGKGRRQGQLHMRIQRT
jgi:hypothetical protein